MSDQTHSDDESVESTEKKFAVGADRINGCQCPVQASVSTNGTILSDGSIPFTEQQATIIEQYDDIAKREVLIENDTIGTITEAEARDVWKQLLKRLYKRYTTQTYTVGCRMARNLGWNDLVEAMNADLEHQGSHSP